MTNKIIFHYSGGFDLQDDDSALEMTDRVLSMLYQYLLSNQSLELNESFQIYLKILSIEHSKFNATKPIQRKLSKRKVVKTHVGETSRVYNYKWAIDVPQTGIFLGKCLLTCTILALAQHAFSEDKKSKLYLYISKINSVVLTKKNYAIKWMEKELEKLFSCTELKQTGPYELKATVIILSQTYKCQFFIFDGINNSSKLYFMYPEQYDDTLKPIFLFRPQFDSSHVIFIRHLNAFYKANSFVCFGCFRVFQRNRESRSSHLCKKRLTCFVCRRFFQTSETYLNSLTSSYFCDKLITKENSFLCSKCNCQIYSQKCFLGHKRFCKGLGYFGYKCLDCKKFTYCRNNTSNDVKEAHVCSEGRICRNCFLIKENWHQCPMKLDKPHDFHVRLGFFKIIFDNLNQPVFVIFYREEQERGNFNKYVFFEKDFGDDFFETNYVNEQYFKPDWDVNTEFKISNTLSDKSTFFVQLNLLRNRERSNLSSKVLYFTLDKNFSDTTYICEDSSSTNLMAMVNWFVDNGICPRLIRKGRNIIILEVPQLHIRFIASNNYVSGNEYDLGKQFDISFVPQFFPEILISKNNFEYQGTVPKVANFYNFNYSESLKTEIALYVSNLQCPWNFRQQMLIHYDQKIQLLLFSMLRFITQSFDFQFKLDGYSKKMLKPINNPNWSIGR